MVRRALTLAWTAAVLGAAAVLFARQAADVRFIEAKVLTVAHAGGGFAVLLAEKTAAAPAGGKLRALVIEIGEAEAQSIALALTGRKFPRPMTHDLTAEILRRLDAKMRALYIHSMQGETFYARLELEAGGRTLSLDCRPSDGLALALRTGAAIRVSPSLLRDLQVPEQPRGPLPPGHPPIPGAFQPL